MGSGYYSAEAGMSYARLMRNENGSVSCMPYLDTNTNPYLRAMDMYLTFREGPVFDWETEVNKNGTAWRSSRVDLMVKFEDKVIWLVPENLFPWKKGQQHPRSFPLIVGW